MKQRIHIIDYGYGNLFSLTRAFSHLGAEVVVSSDPESLEGTSAIIIPGVGAFGDGIRELRKRGFENSILNYAKNNTPILGICLGMQFLFDWSEEFGKHKGLGLIKGKVKRITVSDTLCKIPHIGWNKIFLPRDRNSWEETIFQSTKEQDQVYFAHSYGGRPEHQEDVLAEASYCGTTIVAAVMRNNIIGVQFHPEKSGEVGLSILKNFLDIV
ncbi:MAG: imidazole glycerol phosphate synthase subunit HisH [Parcubacteria group bacterium]|nr:imidazole glycerol phosphate synthase subunit HisH [Parcubacteria group bacterium]